MRNNFRDSSDEMLTSLLKLSVHKRPVKKTCKKRKLPWNRTKTSKVYRKISSGEEGDDESLYRLLKIILHKY